MDSDNEIKNLEFRRKLQDIYSEITDNLQSGRFSPDDNFVLLRQKRNECLCEEDFDPDGTLASKMLGSNAAYYTDQITPAIKGIGKPKQVLIPGRKTRNQTNSCDNQEESVKFADAKHSKNMDTKTISKKLDEFFRSTSKCPKPPKPASPSYSFKSFKKDKRFAGDLRGDDDFVNDLNQRKHVSKSFANNEKRGFDAKWSKEVQRSKEISKNIVADMFRNSNLILNADLDRPLPFEKRFNNGDATYPLNFKKDNKTLMEKLVQHASKPQDMLTDTDDGDSERAVSAFIKLNVNSSTSVGNKEDFKENFEYKRPDDTKENNCNYKDYLSKIPRSNNNRNRVESIESAESSSDDEDSSIWFAMRQNFTNNLQKTKR